MLHDTLFVGIFLPMVLTAFFGVKDLSRTEKKYLILKVLLAFAVVGAGMAAMISNGTFNRYLDEYTGAEFLRKEIGLSWCLYLVLLIIGIRYLFQRKAVVGKVLIKTDCMITTFVVAGTICTLASFFWMPIGRIASYYMIFNTIFISVTWIVSKSYRYGILYRISFASYCMYCFCSVIIENGQSTMPYLLY